jgi:hypothetical protein
VAGGGNHQGLGNELITPATAAARGTRVRCRDRLGGLLAIVLDTAYQLMVFR